ncbi:aldose 1-epimerase family protein [Microbacterium sp. KRD172]|uniref:aldose 1-epimerase family protein n=1 Tax=Microbacterium sp. KRD172 TaxID=2729727 RepID=UPI0019D13E61|nr:aldose 1-epimerase family protein [Microbacterium sp. KRD172]
MRFTDTDPATTLARRSAARIDRFNEADGAAHGTRRLRMITGGGLEIDIHPDRALDVGAVTLDGMPMAFLEPGGVPAPERHATGAGGWLRTFGGGLLVTCGLDSYGAPSIDEDTAYPQHGSISKVPASVNVITDDDGVLAVEGTIRQFEFGSTRLLLRRRIESRIGGISFSIHDRIVNESHTTPAVLMVLYHVNIGMPLLGSGAELVIPKSAVEPRDEVSNARRDACRVIEDPAADAEAVVFLHDFEGEGPTSVGVRNLDLGASFFLDFDTTQLPYLCEWKHLTLDACVLGLEPMNTRTVTSRAHARETGVLRMLRPRESAAFDLTFRFERTA